MYNKGSLFTCFESHPMSDFRDHFQRCFANRAVSVERTFVLDANGDYIFDKTTDGEQRRTSFAFAQQEPTVADIIRSVHSCGAQLHTVFADAKGRVSTVRDPKSGQYAMTVREQAQGGWVIDPYLRKF